MNEFGKIPPQDIESEEALLGALLVDPGITNNVMLSMKPEYFYKESNRIIFSAMQNIYDTSARIDLITVSTSMRDKGTLEQAGGATGLSNLSTHIGTGFNHPFHIASIIDKYVRREYIRVCHEGQELSFDLSNDIADNISSINTELMKIQDVFAGMTKAKKIGELAEKSLENYWERKRLSLEGKTIGVSTGIRKLDVVTGGWLDGDYIILAGRTSMGKTAMALSFATSAFKADKKVQFFSFEMTDERIADRLLIGESKVDPNLFKTGEVENEGEQRMEEATDRLAKMGCFIDDNSNLNIDQLFAKCRIAKKIGECDMIIIDYIGLIPAAKADTREQQIAGISRKIKKYAKELKVPVIALVQVGRGAEATTNKRPRLSDLRESGSLEQDADMVVFAYRPEYYGINSVEIGNKTIDTQNMGIAIVAKHRNGAIGDVLFSHSHGMNVITNYINPDDELEPDLNKPF